MSRVPDEFSALTMLHGRQKWHLLYLGDMAQTRVTQKKCQVNESSKAAIITKTKKSK